jgi:RNA polymerase sigma-70 factor (ECF subfamily)
MAEPSTKQLQGCIERMNAGDRDARDALLGHVSERLRRLTGKMLEDYPRLKRWEEADDVLQNAVLRLLRALEAVKPGSVKEFFRLATRHIRWELRDLVRHYYGPQGLGAHHATGVPGQNSSAESRPDPEPSDSTYQPERLAAWGEFHDKVEALPEAEREVFDLLWYQGLKQAEAAAVLGVSVATVERRWLAARLLLQEALRDKQRDAGEGVSPV